MIHKNTFPKDFIFGTATAAFQIEGANTEDGRGESVWDDFCKKPGKVDGNADGSIACDHYHVWREDIKRMQEIGLKAYRFSIAWPRIYPQGEGEVNEKGLQFYSKLVDELLKAGIEPYITLFHWDLPLQLQKKYGGWKSKKVSQLFAEYCRTVVKHLGDRVKHWMTMNEIMCFTVVAHQDDINAPGGIEPTKTVNQTVHNALLGHGLAVRAIRKECPGAKIGIVENLYSAWPLYESTEHIQAASKAFRDKNIQRLFPLFEGRYDQETYLREYGELPEYDDNEMAIIGEKLDFIGYNYYFGQAFREAKNSEGYEEIKPTKGFPRTDMDWPITPKGLYWILQYSKKHFGDIDIFITENGMAAADKEETNGEVLDLDRLEYYRSHLEMCLRAVNEGINLKGYFLWSLMDNFEWAYGYSKRFGMLRVNYTTQERKLKLSGQYYAACIKSYEVL